MALTKCKECKKEVSSSAPTCPHCGVKNPGVGTWQVLVGLGALAVGIAAVVSCMGGESKPGASEKTPEQLAAEEAACKADLQCWGDKNLIRATFACVPEVERHAKYSHKWVDGTLEPKFERFRWANKEHSVLTFLGDKVQFQNGFGAYQNVSYQCDYDPVAGRVLAVRTAAGRL